MLVVIWIIWIIWAVIYLRKESSKRKTRVSPRPSVSSSVPTLRDTNPYRPSTSSQTPPRVSPQPPSTSTSSVPPARDPNPFRPSTFSQTPPRVSPQPPPATSVPRARDLNIFRPSTFTRTSTRPAITFTEIDASAGSPIDLDIKGLVDALTGAPLTLSLGLFQCQRCQVFYQLQSFDVIKSENGGRCVSCQQTKIINVSRRREQRGRNVDVSIITLENYRQYVGRVITFEGHVYNVKTSKRGTDFAVMFENRSWAKGFKMVVLRNCVVRVGGTAYLKSLAGHRVRVRGLLVNHALFGYQIIVSDRAMILGVQ